MSFFAVMGAFNTAAARPSRVRSAALRFCPGSPSAARAKQCSIQTAGSGVSARLGRRARDSMPDRRAAAKRQQQMTKDAEEATVRAEVSRTRALQAADRVQRLASDAVQRGKRRSGR